jgi:hypothetical protein
MGIPAYCVCLPSEDALVDLVWLAVIAIFFGCSSLLIRLMARLQGEG